LNTTLRKTYRLTSIGRLKGSGGGVPSHATYVTQK
jgi:hypothetical protein